MLIKNKYQNYIFKFITVKLFLYDYKQQQKKMLRVWRNFYIYIISITIYEIKKNKV